MLVDGKDKTELLQNMGLGKMLSIEGQIIFTTRCNSCPKVKLTVHSYFTNMMDWRLLFLMQKWPPCCSSIKWVKRKTIVPIIFSLQTPRQHPLETKPLTYRSSLTLNSKSNPQWRLVQRWWSDFISLKTRLMDLLPLCTQMIALMLLPGINTKKKCGGDGTLNVCTERSGFFTFVYQAQFKKLLQY